MMTDRHDIDALFRNVLRDAEAAPPAYVWDEVRAGIASRSRRRKLGWLRVAATLAALVLAFSLGYYLSWMQIRHAMEPNADLGMRNTEFMTGNIPTPKSQIPNPKSQIQTPKSKIPIPNSQLQNPNKQIADLGMRNADLMTGNIPTPNSQLQTPNSKLPTPNSQLQTPEFQYPTPNSRSNRILLGASFAPGAAGSTGSPAQDPSPVVLTGAPTAQQQEGNLISYAAGMSLRLHVGRRISLEGGLNYLHYSMETTDPGLEAEFVANTSPGKYTATTRLGEVGIQADAIPGMDEYNWFGTTYAVTGYDLLQTAGYMELPLTVNYHLSDRKLSLSVMAGGSAGILVSNKAYFTGEEGRQEAGKTNGLNSYIFSTLAGIGLEYRLSPRVFLGLDPGLRYAIRGISDSPDLPPLSFSLSAGLSWQVR